MWIWEVVGVAREKPKPKPKEDRMKTTINMKDGSTKTINRPNEWTSIDNDGNRQSYMQAGQVVYKVVGHDVDGAIWERD